MFIPENRLTKCSTTNIVGPYLTAQEMINMTKNQEFQERITAVLPKCDDETKRLLNDLYSYWEVADLDLAIFDLRLKKQWTEGSNLYTQKEVDALVEADYAIGFDIGYDHGVARAENFIENPELKTLTKQFFQILDTKEESDSGRTFSPVFISSARALLSKELNKILPRMKELSND